jgi:hypothetical protein
MLYLGNTSYIRNDMCTALMEPVRGEKAMWRGYMEKGPCWGGVYGCGCVPGQAGW